MEKVVQSNKQCMDQQAAGANQTLVTAGMSTVLPALPFAFMPPMMVGFPGPFFPPFLCPPPTFAAVALNPLQKPGEPELFCAKSGHVSVERLDATVNVYV